MEFIYNSCVFILTCLNFSHHQSTPHLMQCTYWDVSSAAQNGFWTRGFWCLLVLLLFFVSLLLYWENISLWGFFHEENKIVAQGQIGWIGRVAHGSRAIFGQKLPNTQHGVGRCAHKFPIMKWANVAKESSKKNSAKLSLSQHHHLVYDTDRTLT